MEESMETKAEEVKSEEMKTMMVVLLKPEDWNQLVAVLGACPSSMAGEAFVWAKSQKPTSLKLA